MTSLRIALTVNSKPTSLEVEPRTHLADALREELGLTGTNLGCEQGVCGACTLMIDGQPQRGCLTLAASCDGAEITTIEGFDDDALMADLRESFAAHHALQCGYCTPGMLISARDIVRRLPDADEATIRRELAGNLCRCTGYVGIVRAIQATLSRFPADHPLRQQQAAEAAPLEVAPAETAVVTEGAATPAPKARGAATGQADKLRQSLDLPMTPAALWSLLNDIETVAACLPGVTLAEIERSDDPAGPHRLKGGLAVALGPIKARFEGEGDIRYDPASRQGGLTGEGQDRASRSRAEGAIAFRVEPKDGGSRLDLSLDYRVAGPLAQFSRGALVTDLVSSILDRFRDNLAKAASGQKPVADQSLKASGLMLTVIRGRIANWVDRLASLIRG